MKTIYKRFFTVALSCLTLIKVYGQTSVPSIISSNQVWDASGSPYIVGQNVIIKQGYSVKVKPGTKIRATGKFRILVEGSLEAIGTKDSVITMDTVSFQFLDSATGYDFVNKTGSHFKYCAFKGSGSGGDKTIDISRVPLLISNCKFTNTYYTIYGLYAYYDTIKVRVENSIFEGNNYGYAIYPIGTYSMIELENCYLNSMYGLYLGAFNTISKCTFNDIKSYSGISVSSSNKKTIIQCCTFKNFANKIISISSGSSKNELYVISNTMDTANVHIELTSSATSFDKMVIKNNNFLYYKDYAVRTTGGSKPGYYDTIIFTKNYWGTTDTNAIRKSIFDFNDDITVYGFIHYGSFLTSKNNNCIEDKSEEFFNGSGGGSSTTSVSSISPADFKVYPNPAVNQINVNAVNLTNSNWKIVDMTGKELLKGEFASEKESINVESLATGVYTIQVILNTQQIATKRINIAR